MTKKQKNKLIRILVSAVLIGGALLLEEKSRPVFLILFFASYLVIACDILQKAWKGIRNRRPFDENFLMALASLGAIALGLTGYGDLDEGCFVMLLYQIGELFESIAVGKSRKNITELMDIRPDYANLEGEDGTVERVDPDTVAVGTVILVQPGEKVPMDGIVTQGESSVDTAALTGESRLRSVRPGEEILSGCINMTGILRVKTTREFCDSTASKILDLMENASSRKSKSEDFISKFARIYTPAVCLSALALAILPPVLRLLLGHTAGWSDWIYRALTFLVISCPCALVISIPLTFFGGLGGAGKAGILIKGSNFMEPLSRASSVVFDKTGTMTKGVFEVCAVHHCPFEDEKLIEFAALAECYSSHPISLSLQRAYGKAIDRTLVSNVHEYAGEGVTANVEGYAIAAGNRKLMKRAGVEHIDCHSSGTIVHVAVDGVYSGHILIDDEIKANAPEAVARLKKLGIRNLTILTGDTRGTAESVAAALGIENVEAELLPSDKVEAVERLLQQKKEKESLLFVGDGINDAPVLSRADVGMALGGIGSDAAIEAADVVLMDDDPLQVVKAIRIARKCMRIVYENIWFAIGIKILCLILSVLGYAGMWLAIFADTGVLILAVLNAIRALYVKNL